MTQASELRFSSQISSAVKDIYAEWFKRGMGDQAGDGVPRGLRAMGKLPADEAWVYNVTTKLADAAQSVELRVQTKRSTSTSTPGTPTRARAEWVDIDDAPRHDTAGEDLQELLIDVNPEWDGNQLQTYLEASDVIHGGCYLREVRGRLGGRPQELYWLPATDVEPVRAGNSKLVTHYDYRPEGGEVERIKARDIIPFRRFNLMDPTTIMSPWEAARYDVATLKRTAEWNANLIQNYGIPPGAWVAEKDAEFGPTELNSIKRALRALRGQGGAGKIPVLPGGLEWVPLSLSQKDADWLGSQKVSRMTVCAIAGVPLVIAGDDEHGGVYAGSRDAERIMWRITLIPKLQRRAARFDSWLVPHFDGTRKKLRVRYDFTKVEALRPAPAEYHQALQHWVDRGVPLNRAIEELNLGAPVDGGDVSKLELQGAEEQNNFERENTGRPAQARPEGNQVQTGDAREAIRSLGKRLYRDEAVKDFLVSGNPDHLTGLVPTPELPVLAEGLRRRLSAEQIVDGWDALKE